MSAFKRYAKYKASGVEWLGDVPEHWEVKRLKFAVDLINEKVDAQSSELEYMGLEHIESWTGRRITDETANSEGVGSKFISNDVLFGKLRPYLAKVYRADFTGLASTEALILRSRDGVLPNYLTYFLLSEDFINQVNGSTFGSKMPRASWDFIGCLPYSIPSIAEQTAIAQFLDQKTAQIDALIAKKQQLLDKLAEQRTALISHAVTKGLDPNAPMKDSGVAWLGEVPEHWNTIRVKYISGFLTSGPRGWSDYIHESGLCIFLQSGDMNDNLEILTDKAKRITPPDGAEGVRTLLLPNDVIVCITGANTGRVAVVNNLPVTTYINQHLSLIRPKSNIVNSKYLALLLASDVGRTYFNIYQSGLKEGLNLRDIAEAPAVIPTLAEQQEIVDYLDQKISQLNEMAAKVKAVIDKLKEYRAALITQAVTGQIDVSGLIDV